MTQLREFSSLYRMTEIFSTCTLPTASATFSSSFFKVARRSLSEAEIALTTVFHSLPSMALTNSLRTSSFGI